MTKKRLLYFSPVHWRSYAQRPHQFIRYFVDRFQRPVLWVDPYVSRLPRWSDLGYSPSLMDQQTPALPLVELIHPTALPVEPLPGGTALNRLLWGPVWRAVDAFAREGDLIVGVGKPCRLAVDALHRLEPNWSFFDAMDHFPAFHSGISKRAVARAEEEVLARVNEVFVSSDFLARTLGTRHGKVKKVLNACEMPNRPVAKPDSLSFGYVGTMASWFDWETVILVARAFPEAPVHLVGPVFGKEPSLPENVRLHGPCGPEEAARRIEGFSIGLIPFNCSPLTQGVDPIKYYEYRALGRPVLTTRFGEMALRGEEDGVFFLDEPILPVVERALAWEDLGAERFRRENSWAHRLEQAGVFETCGD